MLKPVAIFKGLASDRKRDSVLAQVGFSLHGVPLELPRRHFIIRNSHRLIFPPIFNPAYVLRGHSSPWRVRQTDYSRLPYDWPYELPYELNIPQI